MPPFPRNVKLLALTSFLADISGEMLQAVLAFLLVLQGATGVAIGLTGGLSDGLGHLLKPVFGALADRTRRRKPLVMGGYFLAAVSRIGVAASTAWQGSLAFRSADRVGKGMRTAPRDAILAQSAPPQTRGRTFGLHRAADSAGAVVGVALALGGLWLFGDDLSALQAIVLVGAVLGLSTLVPLAFVRDLEHDPEAARAVAEPTSPRYRAFLVAAALLAVGQVSYLFYVLRAASASGAFAAVVLYLLFNVVYAALALPLGGLADRWGKARVLAAGGVLFSASALPLAMGASLALALAAFALLGVAFAATDGVQRALASDLAGSAARSTRLGVFHATIGIATVVGGVVAGVLWDAWGPSATFAWGALAPIVGVGALVALGFTRRAATTDGR